MTDQEKLQLLLDRGGISRVVYDIRDGCRSEG